MTFLYFFCYFLCYFQFLFICIITFIYIFSFIYIFRDIFFVISVALVEGGNPNAPPEYEVSTKKFNNGNNRLRMSRSFGDFYLKQNPLKSHDQQAVTAVPEIVVSARTSR